MEYKVVELPSFPDQVGVDEVSLRNGLMAPRINGLTEIQDETIFAKKLVIGARAWVHNVVFTATDYNTASWASGSIKFNDGTSYSIAAGNTGNVAATTYIYFDKTTELKMTTTYSDALAEETVLLAIVSPNADTAAACIMTVLNAEGTTIDGDKIVTGRIQSVDGLTYFDLNAKRIVINDGTTNRAVFGETS